MKKMNNQKGFTLVETIITLTIFSFLVTAVLLVYAEGYLNYAKNNQKIEVQENLRFALSKMSREIRQASSLNKPSDSNPGIDTNNDGIPSNDCDKITFSLNGKTISYYYDFKGKEIQRSVYGEGNNPVASHVTGLEFQYDSNAKTVTIIIKGKRLNSGEISAITRVLIRSL